MRRGPFAPWLCLLLSLAPAARAQTTPARPPSPAPAEGEGTLLRITLPGELQLRYTAFTTIPLATTPGVPASDQPPSLGQNQYFEHWLRIGPRLSIGDHFRVVTQFDVARLVVPDAPAAAVGLAREPRTELFPYGAFDFRQAYLEWETPVGVLRVGQQAFHLGLGIVANDGDRTPVFGDYRDGDLVDRVALATRPGGRNSDLVVAVAGDLVYRDRLVQLLDGDIALQGVLTAFYQHHGCREDCEKKRVGALVTYRDVSFASGSSLRVLVGDLYARWEWPQPDRVGRVFAGVELAGIFGSTDAARTREFAEHGVIQFGGAAEFGVERDGRYRIALEAGYATGDRNPVDGDQRRFTFNPGHRVGLLMFPEVIAWQTARSAAIASDPRLAARPANGSFLLPTQGGVAGAAYVYPTARVNLGRYVDLRAGAVLGVATTDWVDPVSVQVYGAARNYRGGDPTRRDLGLELDLGLQGRIPLSGGVSLTGGVQGAVMFPGGAFRDASGQTMGTLGLATARLGVSF